MYKCVYISIPEQKIKLIINNHEYFIAPISTSKLGFGEISGSGCTPRGLHKVRIKIGDGLPINTVFVNRKPTGEVYNSSMSYLQPQRDWILTRILWLTGLEKGYNCGGNRDTLRRFIYIHGCPDSSPIGKPASMGCIRMLSKDIIVLFGYVSAGDYVFIDEIYRKKESIINLIRSLTSVISPTPLTCLKTARS